MYAYLTLLTKKENLCIKIIKQEKNRKVKKSGLALWDMSTDLDVYSVHKKIKRVI